MIPTQLGPYTIQSRLGRGGMGAVYEAIDAANGNSVAVKVLAAHLADDAGVRQRFDAEIETLKNLRHPGIVQLLAFGVHDDQPYFAMELVRGKSLEQILRAGRRFTWRETVNVAIEITRSLKYAHDNGVVHRDLKPANLLLALADSSPEAAAASASGAAGGGGGKVIVKLADFGIAKLFGGASHTAHGHAVGTPEYMAPEQATGKPIDLRADLYALGLVMYAMLTGGPPFRGTQLAEIIDKQLRSIPPRVSTLVLDVPPALDELIARLLSKEPSQRPANGLALGRILAEIVTLHATLPAASHDALRTLPFTTEVAVSPPVKAVDLQVATQPLPISKQPSAAGQLGQRPAPLVGTLAPPVGSLGETIDLTGGNALAPTAALALPAKPSQIPTAAASAETLVDRSLRDTFTRMAEEERNKAEAEAREQRWQLVWQMLTGTVVIAASAFGGCLLFKPVTADQLHQRIMAVVDEKTGDRRDVRDEIELFLERHGDDPRAADIRTHKHDLDLDRLEIRLRRRPRSDQDQTPLERDYRASLPTEKDGPSAWLKSLEALLAVQGERPHAKSDDNLLLDLIRRQMDRLRPRAAEEQQDDLSLIEKLVAKAASFAARAQIANDEVARRNLIAQQRATLENIIEVYAKRPYAAEAVETAQRELAAIALEWPTPQARSPATPAPPTGTD